MPPIGFPNPRTTTDARDGLLAWAIIQLGGTIALDQAEQEHIFLGRFTLTTSQNDRGQLIIEATEQGKTT